MKRVGLGLAAALILGLGVLHTYFPLPYVYRVLAYRDADFEDIHRFPARVIAGAATPTELPSASDGRGAVAIAAHPDVDSLDTLLAATETTAFVVVHHGEIVAERYLRGDSRASLQNTFSVTKSIVSALVGLAIRDGAIELDAPITRYLPELAERDPRFGSITVEHLLDMRSGIRYSNDVEFPILNSDDPLIYYHPDLASVVLERTVVEEPPGEFLYNNYNPGLLGVILRRTTSLWPGEILASEIWGSLGVASAGWTIDDLGLERMESGFHARARDLASFGLLYLRGGVAAGRHIVPESWVATSTELEERPQLENYDGRSWSYRLGWWIVPRPDGPSDYCAIGRFGQFIYVSPQYDAVFVRTGPGRGDWGDRDWTELFYLAAERL
ncbi:MAG: beta-lactamase family protein [Acidobacteriota bacterium]|nr:beta-lactamase family protein [Acidobacteriota bacterium]